MPFILGGLVAFAGYLLRHNLHADVPREATKSPIKEVFKSHKLPVLRVALLNLGFGMAFYTIFIYAVSYIKDIDKLPEEVALRVNTISMAAILIVIPFTALLSDVIGRRKMLVIGFVALLFGTLPLFGLMHGDDPQLILISEIAFATILGVIMGGINAVNVELMPNAVRCTGLAFAYNLSVGVFGGCTPMVVAMLIAYTDNPIAPAFWVFGGAALSLGALLFIIEETRHVPLHH